MHQYLNLVEETLNQGHKSPDRTGTGTLTRFGNMMKFDLKKGFPLVTTKKTFFRGAVEELLWFLRGSTDVKELQDRNIHFWDSWVDREGTIGHGYGKQFRRLETYTPVTPKRFDPEPIAPNYLGALPAPKFESDTGATKYKVGQKIQTNQDGICVLLEELPADETNPRIHWNVGFEDTGFIVKASYRDVQKGSIRDCFKRSVYGVGYYGNVDKADPHYKALVTVWRDMLSRCYDDKDKVYPAYGGAGVHVCKEWHSFENFLAEAKKLPGWELKLEYPKEYSIDKDALWASNRYSLETCMWASKEVQNSNLSNTAYFTAVDPNGETIVFPSIGEANRREGLNLSAVHRCLNGKLKTHHGWKNFQYIQTPENTVLRYDKVDQLKAIIATLRHNPRSRRQMVTLWNPYDLHRTTLPPCHGSIIQFYVDPVEGQARPKLTCLMYQRSADLFLGVPINLAVYALLTHLLAHHLDYEVGELVWTGGDCHLYLNHLDQVKEMLSREPLPLPYISLRHGVDVKPWDVTADDIVFVDYVSHPAIPAPVAV